MQLHEKMKKKQVQCSTHPHCQKQFYYDNSTGTMSNTGFWILFTLEFDTRSCLRVLQKKLNLITLCIVKLVANA